MKWMSIAVDAARDLGNVSPGHSTSAGQVLCLNGVPGFRYAALASEAICRHDPSVREELHPACWSVYVPASDMCLQVPPVTKARMMLCKSEKRRIRPLTIAQRPTMLRTEEHEEVTGAKYETTTRVTGRRSRAVPRCHRAAAV